MKIAVLLRGQSCAEIYSHKKKKIINYKNSIFNLMNYFNNYTSDVDYYFHTYNNPLLDKDEIIQIIKPKKYIIEENVVDINTKSQSQIGKSMCNSVLKVINLFYENNTEEYDYIILTRIDLFCLNKINLLLLDNTKINIPYIFF
jgi:hypothetical protein